MSATVRKILASQIRSLRTHFASGTSLAEIETMAAMSLWDTYEIDLPGVAQARDELSEQHILHLSGTDVDTEIDVA